VRDLLGLASITTAERYDNETAANLQIAAAKLERDLGFGAAPADGRSGGGGDRLPGEPALPSRCSIFSEDH
jgi:hypothetical protein